MKTRNIFILLGFIGTISSANAQSSGAPVPAPANQNTTPDVKSPILPSGYLELSFGPAIPLGSFANETGKTYGGYAIAGNNVNLSLGVPVNHSNFGIAATMGSFNNFFDMTSYVNNIQASDESKNYGGITEDDYVEDFITAGLFATYPIQRHFSVDFRLMGGIAICYLPEVDYGASPVIDGDYSTEWKTFSSTSTSFAFDAGADLRYRIRRMWLMLGIDFASANPKVNTTQQCININGSFTNTPVTGNIPMSILNISLGVAYKIR